MKRPAFFLIRLAPLALLIAIAMLPVLFVSCSDDDNPVTPPYEFADLEQQTHAKVNAYRASKGLAALAWNDIIIPEARRHSANMAAGTTPFGHDGFNDRVAAIGKNLAWSSAAENVASMTNQSDPATAAVNAWLASPGHKANIEGNFNATAIGIAKSSNGTLYFTQIFIKTK